MNKLIFVGGLQLSGKTNFAHNLASKDKDKYTHTEMDGLYDDLAQNRYFFMKLIKKYHRERYKEIKNFAKQFNITDRSDQLTFYANYMIKTGQLKKFDVLQGMTSYLYAGELIKKMDNNIVPILDGPIVNKSTRKSIYNCLTASMGNIDGVSKLIIYLDLGLDLSLERLKTTKRKKLASMSPPTEELIRKSYEYQELPEKDEMPNLDVLIIKNEEEIGSAIEQVANGSEK
jgi:tRNA uridine 5-carbamoylmethylation protein Kti12